MNNTFRLSHITWPFCGLGPMRVNLSYCVVHLIAPVVVNIRIRIKHEMPAINEDDVGFIFSDETVELLTQEKARRVKHTICFIPKKSKC